MVRGLGKKTKGRKVLKISHACTCAIAFVAILPWIRTTSLFRAVLQDRPAISAAPQPRPHLSLQKVGPEMSHPPRQTEATDLRKIPGPLQARRQDAELPDFDHASPKVGPKRSQQFFARSPRAITRLLKGARSIQIGMQAGLRVGRRQSLQLLERPPCGKLAPPTLFNNQRLPSSMIRRPA